jgi:hypothetical protein
MLKRIKEFFQARSGMRQFNSLSLDEKDVVFYSEDKASYVHFEPIVKELLDKHDKSFCYLTSSIDDPILNSKDNRVKAFFVGMGMVRTTLFLSLRARILIMTMPDLENYYIKRSKTHQVHYVYVFHNMASTHMVFRTGAYDHYDTVFCVGPHHEIEIRAAEKLYGLSEKNLVKHGNSRLDSVLAEASKIKKKSSPNENKLKKVLIAPSYGENALLEICGVKLIKVLLDTGYEVTVRPHPLTFRNNEQLISQIKKEYGDNPNFLLEADVASQSSLQTSDLLISDYSGVAFEFAFGLSKPVVFIDVPRKINNPKYEEINCEPFEVFIRSKIGRVVSPDDINNISEVIEELILNRESLAKTIEDLRSENIYNVGSSGLAGARSIVERLEKIKEKEN